MQHERTVLRTLLVTAVGLAVAACAAKRPPAPAAPDRTLSYANDAQMLQASNGLKILVLPDPTTNLVEVDVRFDVGSAEDPEDKAGLAHLVEHLMFEMRPFGPDQPTVSAALGAAALGNNAYTSWDTTHYTAIAPRDALDDMIHIVLARMSAECSHLDADTFEREREVVRNEMRQRMATPGYGLFGELLAAVYTDAHPYRRMVGGDDLQLASIEMADACGFIDDYYAPSRATLIVAGNTTLDEVRTSANKYLGSVPGREAKPRAKVPDLVLRGRRERLAYDVEDATAIVAYRLPRRFDTDELAARVFFALLDARLSDALGEDYVTSAGTVELGGERAPVVLAFVSVADPVDLPRAAALIADTTSALYEEIPELSVTIMREHMQAALMARVERLHGRGNMYGDYLQFEGTTDFVVGDLERLQRITVPEVREAAELAIDHSMELYIEPDPDATAAQTRANLDYDPRTHSAADRSVPVDATEANRPMKVPERVKSSARARTFTMDNGMKVMMVSSSAIPIIDIRLVFGSGTMHDDPDTAGVATMAAHLLKPRLDVDHLDDLNAAYSMLLTGGYVSPGVGAESTTFRVTGMSGYVDRLLLGLERVVDGGAYPKTLVEATTERTIELLGKDGVQHTHRYAKAMSRAVFGADHPYTTAPVATAESLANIDAGDLTAFKKKHYRAANATLVIAGKFDMDLVEQHVRWNFERWGRGDGPPSAITDPSRRPDEPMYIGIDSGSSAQVGVTMMYPTSVGIDERYAAREVLVEMIEARTAVVREVLGASYGIHATASVGRGPGMLVVSGDVDAARAGEAMAAMRDALQALRDGDEAFDADFVLARRLVVQRLLADTADSASVARELAFIARHGLPADFHDDVARRVAALTPDDIRALIAEELAPENETILCTGDRDTVANAFAAAGITGAGFLD